MDPEVKAMADITEALSQLEAEQVKRVLKWATERFQVKASPTSEQISSSPPVGGTSTDVGTFSQFREFFDAADPTSSVEKALVAGYWFQVLQGHDDLDSFQLNKELKNLGHPSTNITRDLDSLINRTPKLIIQVRKEGSRRRYKLTTEGIRAVERMLRERQESNNGSVS